MAQLNGLSLSKKELQSQLDRVGIGERADSKVKTFSQGMKQRLGIACALVNDPKLILLDEPMNGLDPQGIADMRNLILHLSRNEKRTVFVSSHLLAEMELVADSMLIIDKGKKIAEGKVGDLLNPADTIVELHTDNDEATATLLNQSQWKTTFENNRSLTITMHKNEVPALVRFLSERNVNVLSVQPRHSLENYFLSLTTSNQHVAAYRN